MRSGGRWRRAETGDDYDKEDDDWRKSGGVRSHMRGGAGKGGVWP